MEERKPIQVEDIQIQVDNIMSVIDVYRIQVDPMVVRALENMDRRIYRDNHTSLREHLYAITDVEDGEFSELLPHVQVQIKQLVKLAEANDAAYVRFIE